MPRRTALALGFVTAFGTSLEARADFFARPWDSQREPKGVTRLGIETRAFLASSNFDPGSAPFTPANLLSYARITTDASLVHGFDGSISAFARLTWSFAQLEQTSTSAASYGLGDQAAGLSFRVLDSRALTLDLQAQGEFLAYDNAAALAVGNPFMGDGSVDLTGGAFLAYSLPMGTGDSLTFQGGAGFTYRTAGFSSHLPWSARVSYVPRGDGFVGSLGAFGAVSLGTDTHVNPVTGLRDPAGSGGLYVTHATNPSLIVAEARAGYRLGASLQIQGTAGYPIWGQNSPAGLSFSLGLQARLGDKRGVHPVLLSPSDYGKSNQGFVNYAMEAKVLRANDRLNLVKIDKGGQDGVEVGQVFDIFKVKQDGTVGEAIARAKVTSVTSNEAALEVAEYFKEAWIEEGFVAKRPLQ